MMYSYLENVKELNEIAKIPEEDIFNYEHSPIQELYDKYFQFCQENLTEASEEHAIQPAKFYYRNEYGINAKAGMLNGYFIIGVNMQTIHSLYQLFYEQNDIFETDEYLTKTYGQLNEKFDVPAGHLMFQLATLFTFYHERAHLFQKSPNLSLGFSEQLDDSIQKQPIIERHILELDADLDAAHHICFHLIEYWKKLKAEDQTQANLQKILSIGVASVFSYFLIYFKEGMKVYYDQHSHPHPLIRITYIVDCLIRVAEINSPNGFQLDSRATLREGFVISETLFKNTSQPSLVVDFVSEFMTEGQNIDNYVNELLLVAESIPTLVKNRHRN